MPEPQAPAPVKAAPQGTGGPEDRLLLSLACPLCKAKWSEFVARKRVADMRANWAKLHPATPHAAPRSASSAAISDPLTLAVFLKARDRFGFKVAVLDGADCDRLLDDCLSAYKTQDLGELANILKVQIQRRK